MVSREQIIEVSLALFKERGFDNVSVADICKELNITRSGFYYYFKTKDSVISSHMELVKHRVTLNKSEDYLRKSCRERFYFIYHTFNDVVKQMGPELMRKVFKHQADGLLYNVSPRDNPMWHEYCDIIREGQLTGEISNLADCTYLVELAIYLGVGIVMAWCNKNGNFDLTEETERLIDTAFGWK